MDECKEEALVKRISQWQEISDTVFNYIKKDPSFSAHADLPVTFQLVTDSVRMEFIRLSDNCSLKDVALVKLGTSPYKDLSDIETVRKNGETFFGKLNEKPIYNNDDVKVLKSRYLKFLDETLESGFASMKDVEQFLEVEDRNFRTFLAHIDEYSKLGVSDITKKTEELSSMIYRAASDKRIKAEEAMVYMSMRTNRRLLLNAELCTDLIRKGKVTSDEQANAYLWMVIQPYLSMDSFAIAMLNEEQKKQMVSIADSYPKMLEQLAAKKLCEKEHSQQIPTQLMRLYLSTL